MFFQGEKAPLEDESDAFVIANNALVAITKDLQSSKVTTAKLNDLLALAQQVHKVGTDLVNKTNTLESKLPAWLKGDIKHHTYADIDDPSKVWMIREVSDHIHCQCYVIPKDEIFGGYGANSASALLKWDLGSSQWLVFAVATNAWKPTGLNYAPTPPRSRDELAALTLRHNYPPNPLEMKIGATRLSDFKVGMTATQNKLGSSDWAHRFEVMAVDLKTYRVTIRESSKTQGTSVPTIVQSYYDVMMTPKGPYILDASHFWVTTRIWPTTAFK